MVRSVPFLVSLPFRFCVQLENANSGALSRVQTCTVHNLVRLIQSILFFRYRPRSVSIYFNLDVNVMKRLHRKSKQTKMICSSTPRRIDFVNSLQNVPHIKFDYFMLSSRTENITWFPDKHPKWLGIEQHEIICTFVSMQRLCWSLS